ncbi:hypothetical protein [Roseicella aquatilis]|uniref:Uncharacterized protein n=1 Tax=Roseicella aquatilis TaxID=2527868 RepID=A0A4R4DD97_9PROT|nr:hypothetical protein [Roseicella aquatilis]TCZ57802.1 hypothetical protein EXY23_17720 [Roseicella aquatilis]
MRRRALLSLLALGVLPGRAGAQQRSRGLPKPPPLQLEKEPALPPSLKSGEIANSSAAPVPDRDREGPRTAPSDRAQIGPSLLYRDLPGRGATDQGSPNLLEEKLYRPAPGVRLKAPFSY